jgi:hypothetical protein
MRTKTKTIGVALLAIGALLAPATQARAAGPAPAWQLALMPLSTNFAPGTTGTLAQAPMYRIVATNIGGAPTSGTVTFEATLPAGLTPVGPEGDTFPVEPGPLNPDCTATGQTVTCTVSEPTYPGRWIGARIPVEVSVSLTPGEVLTATAHIEGGGAPVASTAYETEIETSLPSFGLLPGSSGIDSFFTNPDSSATTQAGSHPDQLTIDLAFPTHEPVTGLITGAGHPRTIVNELPRGLVGNPAATAVRCNEAEFIGTGCPNASQVGVITAMTMVTHPLVIPTPLYNMVPPPGMPGELAFNALNLDIFVHVQAELRSDSDYGLSVRTEDILARTTNPILTVQAQTWGDPSAESHDEIRGNCRFGSPIHLKLCPVAPQDRAFLTMPSHCQEGPLQTGASVASWEEPNDFHHRESPSTDVQGAPAGVDGCNQEDFEPTISSQPTTNLADSPSGLDFTLHQPQNQKLGQVAPADLKDATVTLPEGMVVNPSQADGLEACSQAQIGYLGNGHYSKAPNSCPDASKIGTVEVASPLLAQYTEGGKKPVLDPVSGEAVPQVLQGSVYVAKPFENEFGSLLAIYLAIEDPQSGIVAKLAGKAIPDPKTGQITTRFEENPELPIEDVKLHLFGGARSSLLTPQTCGTHTTTSELVPWSTPEGITERPTDSFQTTASPSGGACPTSPGGAQNNPSFAAGTLSPQGGAYSPFVLKLSRGDGSQRLAGIEATLPPGLAAKFAGVATCSEAQIAQAKSREKPNLGALEKSSPSCPSSSKLGVVDVAAGAGPTPFHTEGSAYLAGPYKGAPLSMAIITPAVAGPFDLGAVVARAALYVDPVTAQGKAVSDPLPQIIEGIPLDVRSIEVKLDRDNFTLNPTSCDQMQITGSALSALGQGAALSNPFQVGGCQSLAFKPKLSLRLKGGTKRADHPKLIATLKAKPGEANIAKAQVKLPPSAFLDQAHIKTICTRVQFAADQCPKGSVYGRASVKTPLFEEPLSGNVYLRSSNHNLPDLILDLRGPANQPIRIEVSGRTDSVKGSLRNTFDLVPDAPFEVARVELFGGKRGLVINSRNLCKHAYRAEVKLDGQNGKIFDARPVVRTDCKRRGRHSSS